MFIKYEWWLQTSNGDLFTVIGYTHLPACADTSSVSVKSRKTRTLTDDQRARKNKRRRELYHEKNQSKKQTKTGAERNRDYKRRLKDFWENNLHPESIAMENPQFTPEIILPTQGQSKLTAEDIEIELNRPPLFIPFPDDQGLDNNEIEKTNELPFARQPRRQRVPLGERQNHLARRNLLFEATIGRKYLGPPDEIPDVANEIPDVVDAPTQSNVVNTGECLLFFYPDSFLTVLLFDC